MTPKGLIDNPKAVFICNHSGGKDSQIMYLKLRKIIPRDRLIVIHAHLPDVEWENTEEFIKDTIDHEFFVVQAGKTFFDMVEHRQMFPSPKNRQCTSDLKRGPIAKKIRNICNTRGYNIVVNCMGLRAEESSGRAKKPVFKMNNTQTNSKRTWYEWLPIHTMSTKEVFDGIEKEGQKPFWVYKAGMTRKSCCFCIMASDKDLCIAAQLRPKLLEKYDELEQKTGYVMMMPGKKKGRRTLKEIVDEEFKKGTRPTKI